MRFKILLKTKFLEKLNMENRKSFTRNFKFGFDRTSTRIPTTNETEKYLVRLFNLSILFIKRLRIEKKTFSRNLEKSLNEIED